MSARERLRDQIDEVLLDLSQTRLENARLRAQVERDRPVIEAARVVVLAWAAKSPLCPNIELGALSNAVEAALDSEVQP